MIPSERVRAVYPQAKAAKTEIGTVAILDYGHPNHRMLGAHLNEPLAWIDAADRLEITPLAAAEP